MLLRANSPVERSIEEHSLWNSMDYDQRVSYKKETRL